MFQKSTQNVDFNVLTKAGANCSANKTTEPLLLIESTQTAPGFSRILNRLLEPQPAPLHSQGFIQGGKFCSYTKS